MRLPCLLGLFLLCAGSVADKPWRTRLVDPTPAERAKALLAKMAQSDKLAVVHGYKGPYVGDVYLNNSLNIPPIFLQDGPQGVGDGTTQVTCWPSALTVTASWDMDLMFRYAAAMALEQKKKGTNVMLAPMVNLARVPFGGRNFESMGEEPYLAAAMAYTSILGIQSQGILGCVKHWVNNNQEFNRTETSAEVGERTEREVYYVPFEAAVLAGVGTAMCSYNKINQTYACENEETLTNVLKNDFGFQGFVMSDWGATHSTVQAANAGLDMEMPDDQYFGQPLADAVASGQVSQARLDDMVYRILLPMFSVGLFDRPSAGNLNVDVESVEHTQLAFELAAAGTVLLKNDNNTLPIDFTQAITIAVIGDDASANPIATGFGSGYVVPPYVVTPLQGIQNVTGPNTKVVYASTSDPNVAKVAQSADICIVFVATSSTEGRDRDTLGLGAQQDNLVSLVAQVAKKTVVVIHHPGAVLMPWISKVQAVVAAFLPGQEDGNAIAAILSGYITPSGKLPVTFPVSDSQTPVNSPLQYPGINNTAYYSEGLLVGYKWYDANGQTPLFPFGHGLSYTSFLYSNPAISGDVTQAVLVSFDVTNTGSYQGSEVPQLYVQFPSSTGEPPFQLRDFKKVSLLPAGGSTNVQIKLYPRDFSVWDSPSHSWVIPSGTFTIAIGSSSRDFRLKLSINH